MLVNLLFVQRVFYLADFSALVLDLHLQLLDFVVQLGVCLLVFCELLFLLDFGLGTLVLFSLEVFHSFNLDSLLYLPLPSLFIQVHVHPLYFVFHFHLEVVFVVDLSNCVD